MLRIFPPTDSFSAEDLFRALGHIAVKSGVGNNRAGLRTVRRTGPPATPYWTDRFGGPSGWRTADRLGCRSPEHHRSDWEACENAHSTSDELTVTCLTGAPPPGQGPEFGTTTTGSRARAMSRPAPSHAAKRLK